MISFKELQGAHQISDIPINIQQNMQELLKRLNMVREKWGRPMTITSGFRDTMDMIRIYKGKPYPKNSAHLSGLAADISDPDGALYRWLKEDKEGIIVMEQAELYGEEGTKGWTHLQYRRPASGNRWFKP